MMKWSTTERLKYNLAYNSGKYFPKNVLAGGYYDSLIRFVRNKIKGEVKLLDIGCGPGFSLQIAHNHRVNAYGIDISDIVAKGWQGIKQRVAVACSNAIPFKSDTFEVVTAWDIMEHIPERGVKPTIWEICRVSKHKALQSFVICLTDEEIKINDTQMHMTVKPKEWWENIVKDNGLKILKSNYDKLKSHLFLTTQYEDKRWANQV